MKLKIFKLGLPLIQNRRRQRMYNSMMKAHRRLLSPKLVKTANNDLLSGRVSIHQKRDQMISGCSKQSVRRTVVSNDCREPECLTLPIGCRKRITIKKQYVSIKAISVFFDLNQMFSQTPLAFKTFKN